MSADVAVTWVGDIGSGLSRSLCFLVRVRGGNATGGDGGGIYPDGAVSGGGLDSWGVGDSLVEAFSVFPLELPPAL